MNVTLETRIPKELTAIVGDKPITCISFESTFTPNTRVRHPENRYLYLTEHNLHARVMGDRVLGMSMSIFLCRKGEEVFCLNVSAAGAMLSVLPAEMRAEGFLMDRRHDNKPLREMLADDLVYTWKIDSNEIVQV